MSAFDPKRTLSRTASTAYGRGGAALLALATLRIWHLQKYVHEVGLQPGHLTRHPVLTSGELPDDFPQRCETLRHLLQLLRVDGGGGGRFRCDVLWRSLHNCCGLRRL